MFVATLRPLTKTKPVDKPPVVIKLPKGKQGIYIPFQSKSQMRGAFSGAFGPEMKSKAKSWADETPNIKKLPEKKTKPSNPNDILAAKRK